VGRGGLRWSRSVNLIFVEKMLEIRPLRAGREAGSMRQENLSYLDHENELGKAGKVV
jgi:hypothetical protein